MDLIAVFGTQSWILLSGRYVPRDRKNHDNRVQNCILSILESDDSPPTSLKLGSEPSLALVL